MAVAKDCVFTEEQITDLTDRLRSRAWWVRGTAVSELLDTDFEQFERPPRIALLLAALNASALRDGARDSLARVLAGSNEAELAQFGPEERHALHTSIEQATPHLHADFLVTVTGILLQLGDTGAIHTLERLVDRATITTGIVRKHARLHGTKQEIVKSFEGSREEEHGMRRVRTAAHVACERLRVLAETPAPGANLLHPASAPEAEQLLRPASSSSSNPEQLLRPEPDPHG